MANLNDTIQENGYSSSARKVAVFGHAVPTNCATVTPNNSTDLPNPGMIKVTGAGTVVVDYLESGESIEEELDDNQILIGVVKRVRATGTTATGIRVYW